MKRYLTEPGGVFVAAMLTAACCVPLTHYLVIIQYQGDDLQAILRLSLVNTMITALPVSYLIWWQLRRKMLLGDELQRLVNRDRLTDVATRDYFYERMNAAPNAYGVSLMVDIDYFKSVNDTHGHQAGDAVINRVATLLRGTTRAHDIVCRYGGEEFVIFLSERDQNSGFEVAERMRKAIAEDVLALGGVDLQVTVSIGGSLKERLYDIDKAIHAADSALLQAKAQGRNKTVFA